MLKRAISGLTRLLWGITRIGLVWIPPVVVLVFGALYIYQVLIVLSAPGTGLTFSYIGRGGDQINIRTGTYAVDPFALRINATDIEISSNKGRIAFADRAWVGKTFDSLTADLGNVTFRMVRREDGSFDALDLLLPDDKSKPPMPVHVKIDSLELTYIDQTLKEPVAEQLTVDDIEVSSSGPDTVVAGSVDWQNALTGNVVVRVDAESNFALTFEKARGDLVQIRPLARRYLAESVIKKLDEWDAREFNLSGDFSLDGNKKGIERLSGEFAWEAHGLRHSDFFANADSFGRANLYNKVAKVEAQVREPGRFASFDGAIDWENELSGQGRVRAKLSRTDRAWPIARRYVPKEVDGRDIGFNGGVSFEGSRFSVTGRVGVARATAGSEVVRDIAATLAADTTRVSVQVAHAEWRDAPLQGWVSADYRRSMLDGAIHTRPDQLVRLEFPTDAGQISMAGQASALIRGTPQKPQILASIDGVAQIRRPDRTLLLGDVDARVRYLDGVAIIDRAVVSGPTGVATATGSVDVARKSVDVDLELGGLDLAAIDKDLHGVGYLKAKAAGPLDDPQIVGDLAVLDVDIAGYTIPKLTATARLQDQKILLSRIDVAAGLGEIGGTAGYDLKTQEITGVLSARDLSISDFLPESGVVGRLNADQIRLSGTSDAPVAEFSGFATDMLVAGIPIDQVRYSGRATRQRVTLDSLTAEVEQGTVEASGSLNIEGGAGFGTLTARNLPLSRIPLDAEVMDLGGTAEIEASFTMDPSGAWSGNGMVRIADAVANGFPIGSGAFKVDANDAFVEVQGGLSSLEGLLEIPDFRYGLEDQSLSGEVLATNMGLRELIRAGSKQIHLGDLQAERIVRDLDGLITAELGIDGTTENPILEVRSLDATELSSLGHALGRLQLEGLATANEVRVGRLHWTTTRLASDDPAASTDSIVSLSGTWTKGESGEPGQIETVGRLVRFDPTILQLFAQDAPEVHASIDADFALRGPTDDLSGQASLTAQDIQYRNDAGELFTIPVTLQTETIDFVDNILTTQAKLNYRGLEGDLTASVPLSAFRPTPDGNVNVELALRDRPLQDLRDYVAGLDVDKSRGIISGRIGLSGQRGAFELSGAASLRGTESEPARLAFTDFDTVLENVSAALTSTESGIQMVASANGSRGGTARVEGVVDLEEFLQGDFTEARISQIDLDVKLFLEQFAIRETIALANPNAGPGEPTRISADRPSSAVLNGSVAITGNASRPIISGEVRGDQVDASIPLEFPETTEGRTGVVEPVLRDFRFVIAPGSKLNIPTGNLHIGGVASLNGPLSSVEVRAPFTVESGVLALPASRVNLDQGTVNVTSGIGASDARADVDLTGSTIVTLRQTSNRYQTYRINLHIRGNLLDPEGILIEGSSDPPDLSQEEIRAIIGQREFVESILSSAFGDGRSDLRESLYTLALPTLTQGLTSELARQLQLDYLVLDYNPFDGPVLRAGREISRGLMVEVSRQLYRQAQQRDVNNSEPLKYEVQLSYRPPVRDPFLSRFRVTAGFNERVPWRVGIEYSSRF